MLMPSDLPMAVEEVSLPCVEFVHILCFHPGARQVRKVKKEGRPWEAIITREEYTASTWGEREEGRGGGCSLLPLPMC